MNREHNQLSCKTFSWIKIFTSFFHFVFVVGLYFRQDPSLCPKLHSNSLGRWERHYTHSQGTYQLCFLRSKACTIIPSKDLLLINTVRAQPKISNDQKRKKKVTEASGREFLFTSGCWCRFCTQFMTPKRDMQISNKKRKVMMSHHLSRKDVKTARRRHKEWSYHQSSLEGSIEAWTEKRNKPTHGFDCN